MPRNKFLKKCVAVQCVHGDEVSYPLAKVEVVVDGKSYLVEAAVVKKLPKSVLLGRDVPELVRIGNPEGALAAMTRAQAKRKREEEESELEKEKDSGVNCRSLTPVPETVKEKLLPGPVGPEDDGLERSTVIEPGQSEDTNPPKDGAVEIIVNDGDLGVDEKDLRELQLEDETLGAVRESAKLPSNAGNYWFYEEDGLLYRHWHPREEGEELGIEQLIIPKQHREAVLRLAHEIPLAGHLGKKKTVERILQRFYWPTLYRDVAEWCRTCEQCQKHSAVKNLRAPLVPLPVIEEPFTRIAMDIVGPLPRSSTGNKYILVVCDYATRYPEAIPMRTVDAEHVAEELVTMFARVGVPREILTDQGTNFMSKLLAELYNLLHIHPIRTSPYPQTDGLVERFNGTLKSMLRKTALEGKDWDKLLPYLLFAYREVPQATTGFSPFELMYGRHVRGPLDILKETWKASKRSGESVISYVLTVQKKLAMMSELVSENCKEAQMTQKRWYDQSARKREFMEGDQVLVLLPTVTNKLMAKWQGPYCVKAKVTPVTYEIDMSDKKKRQRIFHVNMLKGWNTPTTMCLSAEEMEDGEEIPLWKEESEEPKINEKLTQKQKKELDALRTEFGDVMSDLPGKTEMVEHRIETGDAKPVRLPPYRLPHAYRDIVKKELEEMEKHGIIEKSSSDWSSPIVLVKKKDGTLRFCIDFRRLNSVSKTDAYPMPRVDDLLDELGQARFISMLDLTKGYWQVPVEKTAQAKTAFRTPFGLYQFRRMPFGLQGAPSTFQRMMDSLLVGMQDFAAAYLDDLVIFSRSWPEHMLHLRRVLQKLREADLTVKQKKCQLAMSRCSYLGHVVGEGLVRPEHSKVDSVKQFQVPTTKSDVRTFLGLTGYYRKFIQEYAEIAAPLTDLTRKNTPNHVQWTAECDSAFNRLKDCLCCEPILRSPDFSLPFVLQTDASGRAIGAVLSQVGGDDEEHPVAYYSRKLLPREEKYSTVEKECLAIILGIQTFRVYLLGRPFVIQTDHRSLEWLDRLKENNGRLTRWSLALQPYQYSVQYRTGQKNGNADALSRYFVDATSESKEEVEGVSGKPASPKGPECNN